MKKIFRLFLLYLSLILLFTWPLVLNFRSYTPGTVGDAYQFIWQAWWFKYALLDLHQSPLFTNHIFYPLGCSLGTIDLAWFPVLVFLPLQILFSGVISYNIIFLLIFVATGLSAYALLFYLTKDEIASFLGGLIFAFSPQRMGFGLGFMPLLNAQFLPLYILYLLKIREDGSSKNILLSALFLWLSALCSWYYFGLSLIFTFLLLLYYLISGGINRGYIFKKTAITLVVSFILILPFFYPAIKTTLSGGGRALGPQHADLAAYFTPFYTHPIFGNLSSKVFAKIKGCPADSTVFIGYTVLFFLLYTFFKIKGKNIQMWKFLIIIFFLLSLGPYPMIEGKEYKNFPLPFFFLKYTPFYIYFHRLPFIAVLVSLSSAVLFAFGLKEMKLSKIASFFVAVLIIFEFLPLPYRITFKRIPPFYYEIAKEKGEFTILEVPVYECPSPILKSNYYYCFYQYWQTIHHKPIIGGYIARNLPEELIRFTQDTPFIKELKNPNAGIQIDKKTALESLEKYNIRYVILHKYIYLINNKKEELLDINSRNFKKQKELCDSSLRKVFDSEEMLVYAVPEKML